MWGLVGKLSIKKRAKKILRSPRLLLITGILTVLTTTLLFANKGLWRHIELQHQISERQATLTTLQIDEESVSRNVALLKLEDASTIERIARERYGMKRPAETIYQSGP
jgi:cell division protein FtsB